MEFGIEKWTMLMRSEKLQITEGIEMLNQKRIWMHEEKENNKYLGMLETKTFKQVEIKEKIVLRKNEKTSQNQALLQKSPQRNKHLGNPLCKILGTILKFFDE